MSPADARPSDFLRTSFAAAFPMFGAALVVAVFGLHPGQLSTTWLVLHLTLLGGVSQLVVGVSQFFVCAFLATTPPNLRTMRLQAATWVLGTIVVIVGVARGSSALTGIGAVVVLVGLLLLFLGIREMQKRSLQTARYAARWYLASAAVLAVGAPLGAAIEGGMAPPAGGDLAAAHMALNVLGWLGGAIVGTLHTFFPSLTGTRLKYERLQGPTFWSWYGGVIVLAIGAGAGSEPVAGLGWCLLLVAGVLLSTNLIASFRARGRELTAAAQVVAIAQLLLVPATCAGLVATFTDGPAAPLRVAGQDGAFTGLLLAWVLLTVVGSLIHLVRLLRHVTQIEQKLRSRPGGGPPIG
jgi:nitrite reductase (NO-forming)